jgi:hypothetical protein
MNACAFQFTCGDCGRQFEHPAIPDFAYGEFILRTEKSGTPAYLNAINDLVFSDLCEMIKSHPSIAGIADSMCAQIKQSIFSITCDKMNGELLKIGSSPKRPHCGSRKMASWMPLGRFWPLPSVTHEEWNGKDMAEKTELVDQAIKLFLDDGEC